MYYNRNVYPIFPIFYMFSVSFVSILQDVELQKLFKEFVKDKLKKPVSGPDDDLLISVGSATSTTATTLATAATLPTSTTAAKSAKSVKSVKSVISVASSSSSSSSRSSSYIRHENIRSPPRYMYMYTVDLPDDIRDGLRVSNFVFNILYLHINDTNFIH